MNSRPNANETLRILGNEYRMFGLRRTVRHTLAYLLSQNPSDFDLRHRVSTSGSVEPSKAGIADRVALDNAIDYEPTDEAVMRHILRHASAHLEPRRRTFVDLGCGKGRALLMAAELPFIEAIGVEISAAHCRVAERNLATYRPAKGGVCTRMRICQANATEFEFPDSDLLVYLFNPFRGPVLRAVLDNLADFQARSGRDVKVILCSPRSGDLFEAHPAFTRQLDVRAIAVTHCYSVWSCRAPSTSIGEHPLS